MLIFLFCTLIYSIWKENCITIHDKYKFDFTNISNQSIIKYQIGSSNYFIKLCPENTELAQSDFFVLQYSLKNDCQLIITRNNVKIIPRNLQNFSEGLIFTANSEKLSYKNGKTFNIKLDLKCDPNVIGLNNIEMKFNESSTKPDSMLIKCSSSAACPKIIPSPNSNLYNHQPCCKFFKKIENNATYGIDADFSKLNHKLFGIKTDLFINNQKKELFYQPCQRMPCPVGYSCLKNYLSSVWLCENNNKGQICESYGIIDEDTNSYPAYLIDANKGIIIHFKDNYSNRSTNLSLTCETNNFHKNHIKWTNIASIVNNTLLVSGSTQEVCIKHIQAPNTVLTKSYKFESNKKKIELNADEEQTATIKNDESDETKNTEDITIQIESETSKNATESQFTEGETVTNENSMTFITTKSQSETEETFSNTEDSASHIMTETKSETENSTTFMTIESQKEETYSNTENSATFITSESQSQTKETFSNTEEIEIIATTKVPTSTSIITDEPSYSDKSSATTSVDKTQEITDDFTTATEQSRTNNDDGNDSDLNTNIKKSKFHIWVVILIIIGVILFLYFAVGTAFVSIRDKNLHLPNRRFWRRCGKMCSRKEQEYTFKLISDSD